MSNCTGAGKGAGKGTGNAEWQGGWLAGVARCPSPNCDERPAGAVVTLALIHSISLPPGVYGGDAIERLFTNRLDWDAHPYFERIRGLRVSSHFLIRRDGAVLQFVSCDERAWHAGASQWQGCERCNDFSVGIELEGLEGFAFEPPQYEALTRLLQQLARAYPIDAVVGHEHVAPGRKHDPGVAFDWRLLQRTLDWPAVSFPPLA